MKVSVDLECEQVDAIVIQQLKSVYDDMHPSKRPSYGIWFSDKKEDMKEINKMRKAIKRVLEYWGEGVE